jgi:hypothetical protein
VLHPPRVLATVCVVNVLKEVSTVVHLHVPKDLTCKETSFATMQKSAGLSATEELTVLKGENYKGSNATIAAICFVSNTMVAGDFKLLAI